MSTEGGSALLVTLDLFDAHTVTYRNDRIAWLHDCIDWKRGAPRPYQERIAAALDEHDRVAVRGPHTIGKTTIGALMVLHCATTNELEGVDWKCPTTASHWRQLTKYLWPEIRKWARRVKWDQLGRKPLTRFELLQYNLKLSTGEAFAVASNDAETIEGAHADFLLYVYDEAKIIPAATWDSSEGAFAGAGPDTPAEAKALAISTPGHASGRFYDIHARTEGFEDWYPMQVTRAEAIAAGAMSAKWASDRKRQWGADSALYQNRVEGNFVTADSDGIIPLEWIEQAQERWRDLNAAGAWPMMHTHRVGVDVARGGADKTYIAHRSGNVITRLEHWRYDKNTTSTADHVETYLVAGVEAIIDANGIGVGVLDPLTKRGKNAVGFNASEKTARRERSGKIGFVNKRAAAWWNLREMLEPGSGFDVALPPDDVLTGDLATPRYTDETAGGRIQVESKADVAKRLGRGDDDGEPRRSTDAGDAVVMAFWSETHMMPAHLPYEAPSYGLTGDLLTKDF